MVGSDRPGDGNAHGGTLSAGPRRSAQVTPCVAVWQPSTAVLVAAGGSRGARQWNESPQAQDPLAFGLSIVKPCFSIVSTKSIVAPLRYGTLILSVTT